MNDLKEKLFDSAILLALGTGALYLLGIFSITGSALGYKIPVSILNLTPPDVISTGACSILLLPFNIFYYEGMLTLFGFSIIVGLLLYFFFHKKPYGLVIFATVILFFLCCLIMFASNSSATKAHKNVVECLSGKACKNPVPMATIEMIDRTEVFQQGVLLDLQSSYFILQQKDAVLFLQKDKVRTMRVKFP